MLKPINIYNRVFCADNHNVNPKTGEYNDPLMRWPLRGAAFTNEVGEALRPLIGNYATLSWAPALLYIGADIYDKYKNDQTEYSPDSRRCLKQAVFQGLASILLPIIAVKAGQNLFSLFGLLSKDNITFNSKEHIIELAQQFVANGKMRAYKNDDEGCIKEFLDIVNNNLDFKKQEEVVANPFRRINLMTQEGFYKILKINNKENVDKYSEKTIKKLIKIRKDLLKPPGAFDQSIWYYNFTKAMEEGQTKNVAVKSVLNKYLQTSSLNGRFIKTAGGFIALGLAIKPIDKFVEEVLIGKVVAPGLDKTKKPAT